MAHFGIMGIIASVFTVITLLLSLSHTLAKERNPKSLVLGMILSRASFPFPKPRASRNSSTKDMMEPLREDRDGYLIYFNLGSPDQVMPVYMDNRSNLSWVPINENISFDSEVYRKNELTRFFSPLFSSSFTRDICNSSFCNDIHSPDNFHDPCALAGCSFASRIKSTCSRPCPAFAYPNGAGGVVHGRLARDKLMVYGNGLIATKEISEFCFGCVTDGGSIGTAGFGRGELSLPSQLGKKVFSHCFTDNPKKSSLLVLGDIAMKGYQFTPILKDPMYPNHYYIGLKDMTIGNAMAIKVPLKLRKFDSHGNVKLLLDSRAPFSYFREPLYSRIRSSLKSVITYPRAKAGLDLCYIVPFTNGTDDLPSITIHLSNNVSLVLAQGNLFYAVEAPSESSVVKCLLFKKMDVHHDFGADVVVGYTLLQNVGVVYDLKKERVGFQPMDCALAAAAHGLPKI